MKAVLSCFLVVLFAGLAFTPFAPKQSPELPAILNSFEAVELLDRALYMPEPDWLVGPEDSVYVAPTQNEIKELLCFIKDRRQLIHYVPDAADCDDFATEAKYWATVWHSRNYSGVRAALLFGKAYVHLHGCYDALFPHLGGSYIEGYHVLNFVVQADGAVFFFEPQTGILAPVGALLYEDSLTVLRLEY